jgi:hypothetical protein
VFGVLVISATWTISYDAILGGDTKIPLAYALTIAAGITAITARVAIARNRVPLHLFIGGASFIQDRNFRHHRQPVGLIYSLDSKYVWLLT